MISKNVLKTVLLYRNASVHFPVKWNLKLLQVCQYQAKLFHVSSVFFENPKLKGKNEENRKEVKVWRNMTIKDLARVMNISLSEFHDYFPEVNLKPDENIKSFAYFANRAKSLGVVFKFVKNTYEVPKPEKESILEQPPSKPENLIKRPPVVTVMGHVDHGKTTLLDSLRNSFVVQQEFGGITQHIGAFSVEVKPGENITFIDTPGHAAFTAMRSRGAQVTDIVVLVVAADDGVMEQTVESIRIARNAQVPIIVAVNKIDKRNAFTLDEIKQKLIVEGVQVEDEGGDIQMVPISALKKINLDVLTEVILLEAELMSLKGDPTGMVEGVVIESKVEKIGIVATIIVKRGTLRKQKILVAGNAHARVRKMVDENGKEYKEALPSTPVQILGWKKLPSAGDKVVEVKTEKQATAIVREREKKVMIEKQIRDSEAIEKKATELLKKRNELKENYTRQKLNTSRFKLRKHLYYLEEQIHSKDSKEIDTEPHLKLLLKGDVYGSLEVLEKIFETYDKDDECKLSIIHASVGNITQKDMENSELFNAIIYAFNVDLHESAKDLAKEKQVDIRYHNVLYKLIDDVKIELNARIPPKDEEEIQGEAEVLQNFIVTYRNKKVFVAGARCIKGELKMESLYKVLRKNEVIYQGKMILMKNEKKVVKSIPKGLECGLMFESFPFEFESCDKIICYDIIKVNRTTSWNPGF